MEAFLQEYLLLFIPFIVIYYGLVIFCVVDLFKTERPIKVNKYLWLFIILFVSPLGPVLYLLLGKGE